MALDLEPGQRGVLIGMTGTGKSTLGTELVRRWLAADPKRRVLIIDSKPRYRASWTVNGTGQRYRNWVKGDTIAGSVAVSSWYDLGNLWKLYRVVIFQSMTAGAKFTQAFEDMSAAYAAEAFRASSASRPVLMFIDEYYDLLGGGLAALIDRRLLKTIRAGRERSMSVLVGAQRPRSIPIPTLTEATKLYLFQLEFEDDKKYLVKHGPALRYQPGGHQFVLYERDGAKRSERLMQLRLAEAA